MFPAIEAAIAATTKEQMATDFKTSREQDQKEMSASLHTHLQNLLQRLQKKKQRYCY